MRRRGITTVRLLVWHEDHPAAQLWGIVPTPRGRLEQPYAANLAHYVADVRAAGFRRLTVSLAPEGENQPGLAVYDPSTAPHNWSVLRQVRAITKRYGPASTHLDLLNEGAPNPLAHPAQARVRADYLVWLYRRYVHAYGVGDVVVSSNAGRFPPDRQRLETLLQVFARSGVGQPRWFELHAAYDPRRALRGLRLADATLRRHGLRQPLVIGEAPYDDPATAQAIATFQRTSTRRIDEVLEWPLTLRRPCLHISVAPPYTAAAYQRSLDAGR
jgi:hypothetical protein